MNKIDKVIDYLYETNGDFVDKAMIHIAEQRDNMIIQEMNRVCASINVGVYVDEAKLKKWVQMCAELEQLSAEAQREIAIRDKMIRLQCRVEQLEQENSDLRAELNSLQNEHEDYWDTCDDWEDN